MNLAPRKLSAAHRLLVDLLSAGPMPIADCLERAAEAGLSPRTLAEARRRLPIVTLDRTAPGQAGRWRLVHDKVRLPEEWQPRRAHHCIVCGEPVNHWRRQRCQRCGGSKPLAPR